MSRLGKKPIEIPEGVDVNKEGGGLLKVKGPLGELEREFRKEIDIKIEDKKIVLSPKIKTPEAVALWGTYSSHIRNMIEGVTKGFEKKLLIEGVGFKAQLEGKDIVFNLGFSHPVKLEIPEGVKVAIEKNLITVSGIDKEKVGQFSADIRSLKKPEPYKGKGIRYEDEVVRKKAGKKATAAA